MTVSAHREHTESCDLTVAPASWPLSFEWSWIFEYEALRNSSIYAGEGAPRGHGEPVIVVPGFLGTTSGLVPLSAWLARIGYRVEEPGFAVNSQCPDVLLERLEGEIQASFAITKQPVAIVGHSLGGTLARAAATRSPGLVRHVISLGSPLRPPDEGGINVSRLFSLLGSARHGRQAGHRHDPTCSSEVAAALAQPFPSSVRRTAVYTRGDGVVDWRTCRDGETAVDVEVTGSHLGLVFNAAVYTVIATALHSPPASPPSESPQKRSQAAPHQSVGLEALNDRRPSGKR